MEYNNTDIVEDLDWPAVGAKTTVFVGDPMLRQGKRITTKVLTLVNPIDGACYDIAKGDYRIVGENRDKYFFSHIHTTGGVGKAALCDPVGGLYVRKDTPQEVCVVTIYNGSGCYSTQGAIIHNVELNTNTFQQRSLLYSGREGDQLKFTYVQTVPNFSNNVTYGMSTSEVIGYKGAKIKIHSADNEKITYTLLRNFLDRPQETPNSVPDTTIGK